MAGGGPELRVGGGLDLTVEVYCVDPATVPGYTRVEHAQGGDDYWKTTVTCPLGTRILNGGTEAGFTNGSSPSLNTWSATGDETATTYIRAWCVNAGTPTVAFTGTLPTSTKQTSPGSSSSAATPPASPTASGARSTAAP